MIYMSKSVSTYIKNLESKPSYPHHNSHNWADYIELLCLINTDNEVSKTDIVDRLQGREEDLGEGDIDAISEDKELDKEDNQTSTRRSYKSDRWDTLVADWMLVIQHRTKLYDKYYPFTYNNNTVKLLTVSSDKHKSLYIYLLFCSNLYLFQKTDLQTLTGSFEILCLEVLKKLLPSNAIVELFGKNHFVTGKYSGSLWEKMHLLASELNENVNPRLNEENYPPSDTGDGGLDLFGYIPTGDFLPSKHIIFGQCACSAKQWVPKQSSSNHAAWANKIHFTTMVNNVIFIPYCFRNAKGLWVDEGDIHQSFLIDRKRILYYLNEDLDAYESLPSKSLVNDLSSAKEGVF